MFARGVSPSLFLNASDLSPITPVHHTLHIVTMKQWISFYYRCNNLYLVVLRHDAYLYSLLQCAQLYFFSVPWWDSKCRFKCHFLENFLPQGHWWSFSTGAILAHDIRHRHRNRGLVICQVYIDSQGYLTNFDYQIIKWSCTIIWRPVRPSD